MATPKRSVVRHKAGVKPANKTARPGRDGHDGAGDEFPIVGIGASAGGFEAVMELMRLLPANTGMAFAVLQHLDPKYPSKLRDLMQKATRMPVLEMRNGMRVERDHVYVLPPNRDVVIANRVLKLVKRPEGTRLHMPIDHFFQSLAQSERNRAMGVVLSGTGSDGTFGLSAIKAEGGITFAQAEASAKYFDMPRNAIDSGCVDAVVTLPELAKELALVSKNPFVRHLPSEKEDSGAVAGFPGNADAYGKIFFLLKHRSGVDFSRYKLSTLKRSISRRMVLRRAGNLDKYVHYLRRNVQEVDELFHDLLINVTAFFRDKQAFATLRKKVLPKLIKQKIGNNAEIRVWTAGCASGEESYSIAMCLIEELAKSKTSVRIQIFGTDLSENAIDKARAGIYPESIAGDVSPERLRRFFTKRNGGYQISRAIRDLCTFARQNICEDPPFSRLDLICCRNVLIYLGPSLQKKALPIFHYALNNEGYLMLGTSETIGTFADLFTLVDKKQRIYRKKVSPFRHAMEFGYPAPAVIRPETSVSSVPSLAEAGSGVEVQKHADRIILNNYAPCGVVIDSAMQVLLFRGRTAPFIEHFPGVASLNILQMVRTCLMVDLRAAIHKALKHREPVHKESSFLLADGQSRKVNIDVVPFSIPASDDRYMVVLFQYAPVFSDAAAGAASKSRKDGKHPRLEEIERLRSELSSNKESVQSIIEEQEATNDKLKSANEEIESANEELQSTNEELETAKEELQSTNEELTTLNEELSNRNAELALLNDDLNNLLTSINIPILMVDSQLTVRRTTAQAQAIFNLIPGDIGRRLTDIKPNIKLPDLEKMIRTVIEELTMQETQVGDRDGNRFSLRIRPYRTKENKIDGAVITLTDIDRDSKSKDGSRKTSAKAPP